MPPKSPRPPSLCPLLSRSAPATGFSKLRAGTGSLGLLGLEPAAGRSLKPRLQELTILLENGSMASRKSAVCELALLASRSDSACKAVTEEHLEHLLIRRLAEAEEDVAMQVWLMSVLSNTASDSASRERQLAAVPTLCRLVHSHVPEVQHAATLHLATLSHSRSLQAAIGAHASAVRQLNAIEVKLSTALGTRGTRSMQEEASQYARWALRTPSGRNYKPGLLKPASPSSVHQPQPPDAEHGVLALRIALPQFQYQWTLRYSPAATT